MKSSFYVQGHHRQVARKIQEYINSLDSLLSPQMARTPKMVGDELASVVADGFETFFGDWCGKYFNKFGPRAMEVTAFTDQEGVSSTGIA